MSDEVTPNVNSPQQPAGVPQPLGDAAFPGVSQGGQDKSDAITYPLGSQNSQSGADTSQPSPEEDHGSILDKIMGIFSKGKKSEEAPVVQPTPVDQAPTNTTPPPGQ